MSIKDHAIVSKYVYEFFILNINLKKNFKRSLFFNKKKTIKMLIHGALISANYINVYLLLSIVKSARIFTTSSKKNLEDYITFTRVNFHPAIKSWCDWCAIANGYAAFLIDAVNEYYVHYDLNQIKHNNIDLIKLKFLTLISRYLMIFRWKESKFLKKSAAIQEKTLFPNIYDQAPMHIKKRLELGTQMYTIFQEIEHNWCPFQHMQRIAYLAHSDKERYASYLKCESFEDVIKAGEILFNFKHIKCQDCITTLNKQMDTGTKHPTHGKIEDFLELMCRLSR
jgi:hypothetical protein